MYKRGIINLIVILLLVGTILFCTTGMVFARDNYAIGIGMKGEGLDTRDSVREAISAYSRAGYRVYGVSNPGKQHLWEQLYADVQFFDCHGNQECVVTLISGIVAGKDRMYGDKDCIGTDSVHWDADTILVIYSSCQGAGNNGQNNPNSVARKTAQRGAEVVIAWRSSIEAGSSREWTRRYNDALADGYTVIKAMDYANSFSYRDDRVPQNSTIIHHGNTDMKIGKYRKANNLEEIRPEDNLLLKSSKNARKNVALNTNNLENVYSIIKETYPEFNEDNYIISKGNAQSINENTGEIEETEYINLKLKVGDFETLSGFTIKAKNNVVEAIYDNTIDFNKENNILLQKSAITVRDNLNIEELKNQAIDKVAKAYNNKVTIDKDGITYKYVYDVETGKKYIEFTIRTTLGDLSENSPESYDNVKIEI